jgi:hypothetical protein
LEVVGVPRVEMRDNKPVVVVSIKVNKNQKIMTIEEILGRRKNIVSSIRDGVTNDMEFDLRIVSNSPWSMAEFKESLRRLVDQDAEKFNDDNYLKITLDSILERKRKTCQEFVDAVMDSSNEQVSFCFFAPLQWFALRTRVG